MRIVGGSLVHRLRVVVRVVVDRGHAVVNGLHCSVYTICSEAKFLVPARLHWLAGQYDRPLP
jgi:hypothetical protein